MSRFVSLLDGRYARDWQPFGLGDHRVAYNVDARVGSHRATTSSRTPGRINQGTVYARGFEHNELHLCGCGQTQALKPCGHWVCAAPGHLKHSCGGAP